MSGDAHVNSSALAAHDRLPAVYFNRFYVANHQGTKQRDMSIKSSTVRIPIKYELVISILFDELHKSAYGTSETNGDDARTSAYRGQSGHRVDIAQRPTLTLAV